MDYIYDIILNFQNDYYDFYEWKNKDKLTNVKKILVYKVNTEDYLNLKYNDITIDMQIFPKQSKMMLITNGEEVMGLLLDQTGKVVKKSSLLFEEADEVLEEQEILKFIKIKYLRNIHKPHIHISRLEEEKLRFLESFFSKIDITKDEYLLKYIYYDIYLKEEQNTSIIYQDLKKLIQTNINQIYNSIKKITIELKQ